MRDQPITHGQRPVGTQGSKKSNIPIFYDVTGLEAF
jgi:hypothetical protein